ncbi:MAG TPA: MarR family transcriptional regulator [Actinomadura sp.]|jgi:DNA-binding MarR family transcriptional regulator|nr:MarR family transcriptional regulator [Actinomadura sp.]
MVHEGTNDLAAAAAELRLVVGQLNRRLRAASARHELTWSQVAAMSRLDADGPSTTVALARAEAVRPQSMGATLAVLTERGLVERAPDPADGRQVIFSLTRLGTEVLAEGRTARQAWLAQAMEAEFDPAERQTVVTAIELLKRLVRP